MFKPFTNKREIAAPFACPPCGPYPLLNMPIKDVQYTIERRKFEPAYLRLHESGELVRRAEAAVERLAGCRLCPRDCGVSRLEDKFAVCKTGRHARVTSYFPHFGEEDCLRGTRGSGTIFFGWCNLRCVFCQNCEVSWGGEGQDTSAGELARRMVYSPAFVRWLLKSRSPCSRL